MIRMEIALFLVLAFVAYIYFSAGRKHTLLHQTFSVLLVVMLVHLFFDAATIYTVNHLDTVPVLLNNILHRCFIGTMVLAVYLFYQYIAILVEEETGRPRRLDLAAKIYLAEEVSLSVLAEEFHLSAQYISQLFKSEIGVGFLNYLTSIRMEKARKLLVSTDLSIAEISERAGYGDYRVFTKVFKKAEGITPSQYRRDFLEEVKAGE